MKRQLLASRTALLFASQVHVLLRFLYCYLCVSKGEGFQKMNENIKTSFLNIEHKAMLVPKNSNEDLRKVKCYLSPRVSDYYRIVLLCMIRQNFKIIMLNYSYFRYESSRGCYSQHGCSLVGSATAQ